MESWLDKQESLQKEFLEREKYNEESRVRCKEVLQEKLVPMAIMVQRYNDIKKYTSLAYVVKPFLGLGFVKREKSIFFSYIDDELETNLTVTVLYEKGTLQDIWSKKIKFSAIKGSIDELDKFTNLDWESILKWLLDEDKSKDEFENVLYKHFPLYKKEKDLQQVELEALNKKMDQEIADYHRKERLEERLLLAGVILFVIFVIFCVLFALNFLHSLFSK